MYSSLYFSLAGSGVLAILQHNQAKEGLPATSTPGFRNVCLNYWRKSCRFLKIHPWILVCNEYHLIPIMAQVLFRQPSYITSTCMILGGRPPWGTLNPQGMTEIPPYPHHSILTWQSPPDGSGSHGQNVNVGSEETLQRRRSPAVPLAPTHRHWKCQTSQVRLFPFRALCSFSQSPWFRDGHIIIRNHLPKGS